MGKLIQWTLIVMVVATITIAGLLIGFNVWAQEVFYVALYDAAICFGTFFILRHMLNKGDEEQINAEKKRKWDYSMEKCAEMTKRALGGVSLQWRQGRGRSSAYKIFKVGMNQMQFYVFDAVLSETQEPVMVFWDCDNENVAGFFANPSAEMYDNPFKFWTPMDNSGAQFVTNRFGKNGRPINPGIRIGFDDGASMFGGEQPQQDSLDQGFMDDVANNVQR